MRGIGAGNYDRTYFLERRTTEDIRQPHSIELQTLGELGLVGGVLLAVFLVAVLAGFARRARAAADEPRVRGLAVAAGGAFLVWLVHTSVDWLHLIPGITGIALASPRFWSVRGARPRAEGTGSARIAVVAVCGVAVIAGRDPRRPRRPRRPVPERRSGRARVGSDRGHRKGARLPAAE